MIYKFSSNLSQCFTVFGEWFRSRARLAYDTGEPTLERNNSIKVSIDCGIKIDDTSELTLFQVTVRNRDKSIIDYYYLYLRTLNY